MGEVVRMFDIPLIDTEKCRGCGLCVFVCLGQSRAIINNVAFIINPEACVWCTRCEDVCPTGAASCPLEIITKEEVK